MTVYLIQQPPLKRGRSIDMSTAADYGHIVTIFGPDDQPSLNVVMATAHARECLRSFNDNDYLLWARGDPVALGLAFVLAGRANQGRVKMLRWERKRDLTGERHEGAGFYLPITIDI